MDDIDIKDVIFDLTVVLNKLAQTKKDAQRHMQGCDDPDNLRLRVARLEDTLTDVSIDVDTARDDIYKVIDLLEDRLHKMAMDQLSMQIWED